METNHNLLNADLQIDAISHSYLSETAKWATFLAILGFIGSGILAIIAVFAGRTMAALSSSPYGGSSSLIGAGVVTIIYLIIAVIYFFLSVLLFRFAAKMKTALTNADQEYLNNSFLNLKNLYKMMGILAIIYLAMMVLGIIFAIAFAAMR